MHATPEGTAAFIGAKRQRQRIVLLLGILEEAILRLAPQLGDDGVQMIVAPDAHAALGVCRDRRIDLLVLRHPVAGMTVDDLVGEIRLPGCPSRQAFILVLTQAASNRTLRQLEGPRTHFTNRSEFSDIVAVLAREALGVARRVPSRFMVELIMRLDSGRVSRFCQVANLSESGMLVQTTEGPARGERVSVTFTLPDAQQPIRAEARVVRRTGAHEIEGVALRFVEMDRRAQQRLRAYVAASLSPA